MLARLSTLAGDECPKSIITQCAAHFPWATDNHQMRSNPVLAEIMPGPSCGMLE